MVILILKGRERLSCDRDHQVLSLVFLSLMQGTKAVATRFGLLVPVLHLGLFYTSIEGFGINEYENCGGILIVINDIHVIYCMEISGRLVCTPLISNANAQGN